MVEKQLKTRIVHKHDTESNWLKAENFIPKQGELIIYDRDQTHNYERFKFGNGVDVVSDLPFSDEATLAAAKAYAEEAIDNINITYEINSAGVLCPSIKGDSWIGMQDASLLINQAQSATQNDNVLEVI